jgi:hypothetical protein
MDAPFNIPFYVFPNNQQTLALSSSPLFLQILSWSEHLYLQTEQAIALLVPPRPLVTALFGMPVVPILFLSLTRRCVSLALIGIYMVLGHVSYVRRIRIIL